MAPTSATDDDDAMPTEQPASYARGIRLPYAALPAAVRDWVQDQLGGPVTRVEDRVGGFAPGCAAVVATNERAAFCKATGSLPNALSLELYRGERARLAALPEHPALPHPIAAADLALPDQVWAVTLLPALPGEPPAHPWTEPVARLVMDRLGELQTALAASVDTVPSALPGSQGLVGFLGKWAEIADDPADPWHDDEWVAARLHRLRAADARLQQAVVGLVPAHIDLRADNILLGPPDGPHAAPRVWFVDWAAAMTAAPWVDPAILACDLVVSRADRGQGGTMDVAGFLASHPVTAATEPSLRWAMMIGMAAAMHRMSQRPDPPGLPTIRPWQHRCGEDLLDFVRSADLGSSHRIW
nr:aminoglycoside phosphotransferase family protein [uncultured Friedmanniella sp.]